VEIERFQLQQFTVSMKELAEWFGLEVARLVVDECLAPRQTEWRNTSDAPVPKCNGCLGVVVPERKQAINGH
jgi:hypothetical protein